MSDFITSKIESFVTAAFPCSPAIFSHKAQIIEAAPESKISGAKPAGYPSAKVYSALYSVCKRTRAFESGASKNAAEAFAKIIEASFEFFASVDIFSSKRATFQFSSARQKTSFEPSADFWKNRKPRFSKARNSARAIPPKQAFARTRFARRFLREILFQTAPRFRAKTKQSAFMESA